MGGSGTVEILELGFSKKDRRRFIEIEFRLNRSDPLWVPPLRVDRMKYMDPVKNPFFEHAEVMHFVAVRDGRDVGRIAAIKNRLHEEIHDEPVGFFGFLECPDDAGVLGKLLDAAAAWLAARGLTAMRGPISYDTNEVTGALIEPFDLPPTLMMPYNRAYLPPLLEGAGLAKEMDLLAYRVDPSFFSEKIQRISARLRKRERVEIRSIDMKRFEEEVRLIRDLYNAAWEKNWGFVPMTDAEIAHMAANLKQVIDPEFILFGMADGKVMGFAMCLPDANQALHGVRNGRLFPFGLLHILRAWKKIDRVRVLTLGTIPEYRNRGMEILFYQEIFERARKTDYVFGECSWILETNKAMNGGIIACGGYVEKRYRVYERPI